MLSEFRYERHIELREIGTEGQRKLLHSKILIVGAGGLGCPVALYLAAAGVGEIMIADDDKVTLTNLQRQILYRTQHQGLLKTEVAATELKSLNPEICVNIFPGRMDKETAPSLVKEQDIVIDCCDNFETRYLLNDLCLQYEKTLVSGSAIHFDGQVCVFRMGAPCYACLYPHMPSPQEAPACTESAVFGPAVGVIGTIMAAEVIKEILNIGEPLAGSVISYSALQSRFSRMKFDKLHDCPACSMINR